MGKVVVVGSLNCDLVMRVERLPSEGETVGALGFETFVGGKGCNQAIAAARAGADVSMVGCVGDDEYGSVILEALSGAGVDAARVRRAQSGTGVAQIFVDRRGANVVGVAPRANGELSAADVEAARSSIQDSAVLLLQLEIPLETAVAAARVARSAGTKVVLNPAPMRERSPALSTLLGLVDVLIPNETEAARLAGYAGVPTVIVTLGGRGALLREAGKPPQAIDPFSVDVVDTTAAGDAFCGAFAASLAGGANAHAAARWATAAGALACTRMGAEPSLPHRPAIERLLATQGT
ncbi:MAG: ribokinase [Polyangiaceae bacterium]|nr:ribokinase [Polyangiaceae bacterium]